MDQTDKNAPAPKTDPNTGMPAQPPTSYDTIRPDKSSTPGFAETLSPGQVPAPPSNGEPGFAETRAAPPGSPAAAQAPTGSPFQMEMASPPIKAVTDREVCGYKLGRMLGRGGFGKVYLADAPGGVPVAVKIVEAPRENEAAQRELQALDAIKTLRHLHLLSVHAFHSLPDQLVIVTELAECSLRDRLAECRKENKVGLPVPELVRDIRESAEALDYLHDRKMFHRDIKPENILLVSGHAKVADFGLVRVVQENRGQASVSMTGTLAYMPPEVFRGQVHRNSDQYSLALTYCELRFGQRFVSTQDMVEAMVQHVEKAPDLSRFEPGEREILQKALAKDPAQRWGSCTEMARALEAVSSKTAVNYPSAPAAPPAKQTPLPTRPKQSLRQPATRQQRRRMAAAGLLGVAALGLIAAVLAFSGVFKSRPPATETTGTTQPGDHPALANLPAVRHGKLVAAEGSEIIDDSEKKYFRNVDLVLEDGTKIPFVLVARKSGDREGAVDIPTFYIMANKVSYGLFAKIAPSLKLHSNQWEKGAPQAGQYVKNPDWPVYSVEAEDAQRFALWLGGDLPTLKQWDKAAGGYDRRGRDGIIDGEWKPGDVAVDRGEDGPLPVGAAARDFSLYGVHDVAGNGYELTKELQSGLTVPLHGAPNVDDRVILVGRPYSHPGPLMFNDVKPGLGVGASLAYSQPDSMCSFRVVLNFK
ncbi:MAG: protein kinase domain-containing protein [Gemmataceae bacterium]